MTKPNRLGIPPAKPYKPIWLCDRSARSHIGGGTAFAAFLWRRVQKNERFCSSVDPRAGSLVPVRVRHLFIKGLLQDANLIRSYGFVYLSSLSERLNIVRLSARGDYGIFSSVPTDLTIFRRYAQTGKWSNETNKLIKGFFKAK